MGSYALAPHIELQRRNLPLWIPVLLAFGIGAYFGFPFEPEPWMLAAIGGIMCIAVLSLLKAGPMARLAILALVLPLAGYSLATFRSWSVEAPVLSYSMTANVEGRIAGLDKSSSGRARVLLSDVVIYGQEPGKTPSHVRISMAPDQPVDLLEPGQAIIGQARLSPPGAPVEPGGFDFRRHAWFKEIGAVGYSNTPFVEREAQAGTGWRGWLFAIRVGLSRRIQAAMPTSNGGFAAAILTGDRSAVDPQALATLRASNLAHLLAISGLHMGLLAGFVFALVRYGLALLPGIALRYPTKKIAAILALLAGAAYLGLSGANVATQRAFIMTAVVLTAVLLDRPAFTMRSVALAATILLVMRPESLTEAGFQMSFAATTALIATFEWLRSQLWWRETLGESWRFARPVLGVAATSLVAGAATAPISAYHFNMLSQYGLIANVLAVPAMGLVVMPAAVIAGFLSLLGLAAPALWAMDLGIGYILSVAKFVAGLDGAVRTIPAAPVSCLALISLGMLFVVIWQGRARFTGLLPVLTAFAIWAQIDRPDILISENGRLLGVMTQTGRVLNSEKGNSFSARAWLRGDGDGASQAQAFARRGMDLARGRAAIEVSELGPVLYNGSRKPDEAGTKSCRDAAILLAPNWRYRPSGRCYFIGKERLAEAGALAFWITGTGFKMIGSKEYDSNRPWGSGAAQ